MDQLPAIYRAVMKAGERVEIAHFGAYAANALRLEKGYPAWGMDLSTERSPVEAGLGRFVKSANRTFTGRRALQDRATEYSLRLLEIEPGNHDPFSLHPILHNGTACGLVTSGAHGHRTDKNLAFAYVRPDIETGLTVEICGQSYAATVLTEPPYDPDNKRMRGTG